jgi:hypothetical protein
MMAPQRESESTEITANSSSAAVKDQSYHSGEDSNNDVSLQESDPFSGPDMSTTDFVSLILFSLSFFLSL